MCFIPSCTILNLFEKGEKIPIEILGPSLHLRERESMLRGLVKNSKSRVIGLFAFYNKFLSINIVCLFEYLLCNERKWVSHTSGI